MLIRAKRDVCAEITCRKTDNPKQDEETQVKTGAKERDFPNITEPVDNRNQKYRLHERKKYHKHRNHKRGCPESCDCADRSGDEG